MQGRMHEFGGHMAAHATRSASGAASSSDDASRCLLLALSHDELGVIVDGLADPLQPVVAEREEEPHCEVPKGVAGAAVTDQLPGASRAE